MNYTITNSLHCWSVETVSSTNSKYCCILEEITAVFNSGQEDGEGENHSSVSTDYILKVKTTWLIINLQSLTHLPCEVPTFFKRTVQVPAVQGDHHLPQEDVTTEAAMMPDRYRHRLVEQFRAADGVLV